MGHSTLNNGSICGTQYWVYMWHSIMGHALHIYAHTVTQWTHCITITMPYIYIGMSHSTLNNGSCHTHATYRNPGDSFRKHTCTVSPCAYIALCVRRMPCVTACVDAVYSCVHCVTMCVHCVTMCGIPVSTVSLCYCVHCVTIPVSTVSLCVQRMHRVTVLLCPLCHCVCHERTVIVMQCVTVSTASLCVQRLHCVTVCVDCSVLCGSVLCGSVLCGSVLCGSVSQQCLVCNPLHTPMSCVESTCHAQCLALTVHC